MSGMELWTTVRFSLYPVLLVAGAGLAMMFWQSYRATRLACNAWAFWLAVAAAVQGLAGFLALLASQASGFNAGTSAIFSIGVTVMTMVVVCALLALGVATWRGKDGAD